MEGRHGGVEDDVLGSLGEVQRPNGGGEGDMSM